MLFQILAPAAVVTLEDVVEDNDENDNNQSLFLQCEEEPLSAAQFSHHKKKVEEFQAQMKKLESLAAKPGTTITSKPDGSVVFKNVTETTTTPTALTPTAPKGAATSNYRLLMDPRTGRILGTINGSGNISTTSPQTASVLRKPSPQPLVQPTAPRVSTIPSPRLPTLPQAPVPRPVLTKPSPSVQPKPQPKPCVNNVKPAQVVDLTRTSSTPSTPTVPNQGSTNAHAKSKYPALMVQPKPHDGQATLRRSDLDQKVKSLLVLNPAKLTEWLIKEGLVPQEQTEHGVKLKLGMYSDSKKFPNSGGYVWLTEDSRNKFVSVFKGKKLFCFNRNYSKSSPGKR